MKAKNLMVTNVITVKPTHGLEAVSRTLTQYRIKGAPVVDDDGRMVGIVSKDDILAAIYREEEVHLSPDVQKIFSSGYSSSANPRPKDLRVEDIMTKNVVTAGPEDDVQKISALMVSHHIHRVPIMDSQGVLMGLISAFDVLKAVANGECKFESR